MHLRQQDLRHEVSLGHKCDISTHLTLRHHRFVNLHQGDQGPPGQPGETGSSGDTGQEGERGLKGSRGTRGPQVSTKSTVSY